MSCYVCFGDKTHTPPSNKLTKVLSAVIFSRLDHPPPFSEMFYRPLERQCGPLDSSLPCSFAFSRWYFMTIFCSRFVVHSFIFPFSNCLTVFRPLYIFLLIIVSLCIGCMFCFVWFPCVRPYFPYCFVLFFWVLLAGSFCSSLH